MDHITPILPSSPLMLCDRLISLAQEADRAGYAATAGQLAALVDRLFDEQPRRRRSLARPLSGGARRASG